jgi:hypothetical protein
VFETFAVVLGITYLVSLGVVTFVIARATRKQIGEEEAAARERGDREQDR